MTGKGFFTDLEVPADAPRAGGLAPGAWLGDVGAESPRLESGVGFVLFVRDGKPYGLEGYTFGEPWPSNFSDYNLFCVGSGRDLSHLTG